MRLRGLVCALGLSLVAATCVSTPDVASVGRGVDISWLPAAATLQQDPGLDEAAALLLVDMLSKYGIGARVVSSEMPQSTMVQP